VIAPRERKFELYKIFREGEKEITWKKEKGTDFLLSLTPSGGKAAGKTAKIEPGGRVNRGKVQADVMV